MEALCQDSCSDAVVLLRRPECGGDRQAAQPLAGRREKSPVPGKEPVTAAVDKDLSGVFAEANTQAKEKDDGECAHECSQDRPDLAMAPGRVVPAIESPTS